MSRVITVEPHFDVIADTEGWLVVNKAAPLVVHPTKGMGESWEPTLLGGVDRYLAYEVANGGKFGLINRLDRETSGVVVISKNKKAGRMLHMAMEHRQVKKVYRAIAFGWPDWEELVVDEPIARVGEVKESRIWVKQMVHESGKPCRTRFEVIRRLMVEGRRVCELRAFPHTGRMHQIRVHLAHAGHPIVGDKIYGPGDQHYLDHMEWGWTDEMEAELMHRRHCLHAESMSFECVGEAWVAALPADMAAFLDRADRREA